MTKYESNGNKVWTRVLGTSSYHDANAVSLGMDGSVYIAGGTYGNFDGQTSSGRWDVFLTKYDPSGTKIWTKLLGTSGDDIAYGLTTTDDGSIYVSGDTNGSLDGQQHNGGNSDAFVAKYDSNGSRIWTKIFGTSSFDGANNVVASSGSGTSIYVVGETLGNLNGQTNNNVGLSDAFVIKLTDTPSLSFSGKTFSLVENSILGKSVGTLSATSPASKSITYSMTGGNIDVDKDGKSAFKINSSNGVITVNDSGDLNYEATKTFSLTVQASDGSLSSTATATINLTNVDEDPTGSLTINGTAIQGNQLTALSTVKDPDGNGTAKYQWLRNDVAISGANTSTYTLNASDVGKSIKVRLSYTDGGGFKESVTSAGVTAAGLGPGVSISGSDKTTGEDGDTAAFTVSLNAAPTDNVTLNFAASDTTEAKLNTLSLTFTKDNWNVAQTLTVTGVDDDADDGNVAYNLNVTLSSADAQYAALKVTPIALVNNDDAMDKPITKYIGTSGDDTYRGSNGNDVLYSGYGNDVLYGGRGDDRLYGEQNGDVLFGEDGNDKLYGGYEADELYGGTGSDELYGQEDEDRLEGGAGNDYLDGGTGADRMIGGSGNDTYFVDNAKDVIDDQGAATDKDTVIVMATISYALAANVENAELKDASGAASLTGNTLNNDLTGNGSKNTLDGGAGNDVLDAGAGDDILIGGVGDDSLSGGAGDDQVDYSLVKSAVNINLASGKASGVGADTLTSIEDVVGGAADDIIVGNTMGNELTGGLGADRMSLGADKAMDMLVYRAVSESLAAERDRISQFVSQQDRISLSGMDADSKVAGDQAFQFNNTTAKANALWYRQVDVDGDKKANDLIVYADINGDAKADFEIGLVGVVKLVQADFVL